MKHHTTTNENPLVANLAAIYRTQLNKSFESKRQKEKQKIRARICIWHCSSISLNVQVPLFYSNLEIVIYNLSLSAPQFQSVNINRLTFDGSVTHFIHNVFELKYGLLVWYNSFYHFCIRSIWFYVLIRPSFSNFATFSRWFYSFFFNSIRTYTKYSFN